MIVFLPSEIKSNSLDYFKEQHIDSVFKILQNNNILTKLNNQGRRTEEVYFSWMRGYITASYFIKAISFIFDIKEENIKLIGNDKFENPETFKRTPKADLEIELSNGIKIRIEVQSGFQGVNDIKQHKVLEAKKNKNELNIDSLIIHFDFFNGQVAFVKISDIEENDYHWITRTQMEGQIVFNIDANYFTWKLTELPKKITNLSGTTHAKD